MNLIIKKQAKEHELIAMAWHEASHVICGLYNFLYIESVSLMSEKLDYGLTSFEIYDPKYLNNKLLSKILVIYEIQALYAGLVGEKIYYKNVCGSDKFPMYLRKGSADDIKNAAKLIDNNNLAESGKKRLYFKKQIQSDTKEILLEYWDDVRIIAHALFKSHKLNFDEICQQLSRKSKEKTFWKSRFKTISYLYEGQDVEEKKLKEIILQNKVISL